jgi:hypothetical protein
MSDIKKSALSSFITEGKRLATLRYWEMQIVFERITFIVYFTIETAEWT